MAAGATVFFGLWLQKPMRIAAANPSGWRFADALARCVEERPGKVLELGAGTGSLTRGLVRAGCPPDRIIAVENGLAQSAPGTDLGVFSKTGTDCSGRAGVNQISPISQISCVRQYRTIWISDIHLGTRGCKADFLIDFLRCNDADTMYLVGDIIDGWRLKRSWYWPQTHNDVVQKVLRKVRKGTRVIYVPGNHDEWLRDYTLLQFGGVEVAEEVIHVTADGRQLLVLHGDVFDAVVKHARWLAMLGDHAYTAVLWLNRYFNIMRRRLGYQYWSLSAYLKHRVKNAVQYIGSFADAVATEANRRGVDGVVCGHIHHAEIREMKGILYCNDGDWVESCTALVEHFDGRLELVHWIEDWTHHPLRGRTMDDPEIEVEVQLSEFADTDL